MEVAALSARSPLVRADRPVRRTLALLALEAQLLDALTFCLALRAAGIGGESNPLMAGIYHAGGLTAVLAFKLAGALLVTLLARRVPPRWALLPAVMGLVGALTNLLA